MPLMWLLVIGIVLGLAVVAAGVLIWVVVALAAVWMLGWVLHARDRRWYLW